VGEKWGGGRVDVETCGETGGDGGESGRGETKVEGCERGMMGWGTLRWGVWTR